MHINASFSSESGLNQLLDFLYAKSLENKTFTGLLEAVGNEATIVTAIHNIKSNKGSKTAGVDNVKMDKFLQMPKDEVVALVQACLRNYLPKPARRIYIDKGNGKLRPLGVPTIFDRIVEECIRIIIEPICEAKFYPHSYGFRPYRAQKHAIIDIVHTIRLPAKPENKAVYALEGDIRSCFDSINHRILLQKLWKIGIHDKRIISIIKQMLKAGYTEHDIYYNNEAGTKQGGILSPLLSNVYLNDFDWYVGRQYSEPHRQCKDKQSDIKRLRRQGKNMKYNIRFADDWIILTTKRYEAERMKIKLTKYFKHRLKLDLSDEKTKITDMRIQGAEFLGFTIRAEKARRSKSGILVGKSFADMKRITAKITKLCKEVHVLKSLKIDNDRIAQIQYINSAIMGITEYIKTGICSRAFKAIDYRISRSCFYTWKYLYPKSYSNKIVRLKVLNNLPHRHEGLRDKTFAIQYEGKWIGITKAYITHAEHIKYPFNQKTTPYTSEGRKLYVKKRKNEKPLPRDRPSVNSPLDLKMSAYDKSIYNFEYFMNREYAFNRDRWKCRCCGTDLSFRGDKHCHHVDSSLPIDKVNKVPNLAWICVRCHYIIHGAEIPEQLNSKIKRKILNFQEKLNKSKSVSE